MRITLTVTSGPHKGRVFMFSGHDTFLVGRSKQVHFRLPLKDKYFSRIHFLVEVNAPHCRLMDMGSRNGTYVNGKKVDRADLQHGDRIRAGHTRLLVSLERSEPVADVPTGSLIPDKVPAAPPPSAVMVETPRDSLRPGSLRSGSVRRATPLAPSSVRNTCLVCARRVKAPASLAGASPVVLCPTCVALVQDQEQYVPGYQIVRELGRGNMGVVYLAIRTAQAHLVALKTILPAGDVTEGDVQRFLREARILEQLDHPHIVPFHEMGQREGRLFFVMDYVPGLDAGQLVKQQHPLDMGRAVDLTCQLLEALAYAHDQKIVHRDIKPANLLIAEHAGGDTVKLADFGLARVYQTSRISGLTVAGDVGGTIPFMAPEQITQFREAKPAVDQYAAAATLYYLLTGQFIYDFPPTAQQRLQLILMGTPVPIRSRRKEVPPGLAEIIHRGLSRLPAKRFADVSAMRAALLPFR
jgi:serine/threonine-protein kinase